MVVVHAMLSNAAIAILLAIVAVVVGRLSRSPAVRHAAWVIVLLKLVTPPIINIPLPVLPASWGPQPGEDSPAQLILSFTVAPVAPLPTDVPAPPSTWWERHRPAGVAQWLLVGWAVGTVGWFVWQSRRVLRFRRRVHRAEDAPAEVAEAVNRIAASLGITNPPAVKIASGIGSPMLWGWGHRAVVLFPRDLLPRLSTEARDTLLAHELAHFLRRDHWVRVLEFVASGLYWWHPVVWLARLGIESAEEECCDSWVVGGLGTSPRLYAEALLATVDYEAELRRPCLPPGACAANRSARLLRRRLFGLVNADHPYQLRVGTVVRVVVIVVLLTRPVLMAAIPESSEVASEQPVLTPHVAPKSPPPRSAVRKSTEPRAWATATAPGGGPIVLARDNEVILRFPDGSTQTLGPGRPLALAFARGGKLATVGPGSLLRAWDDRANLLASSNCKGAGRAVAYTPDGLRLLVLDSTGEITVRDPQTLAVLASWTVEGPANSITCSPDGRTVAVSCGSWLADTGWVEIWSIAERRKLTSIAASAPVGACRFTPSGDTIIVGGWNGLVAWRSLPSGTLIVERQLSKDLVATTAFCPNAEVLPLEAPPEPPPPFVTPDGPDGPEKFGQAP